MPGHKGRGDFKRKFPVAEFDVTELPYSDNLACPTGIIARAQRDIAEILGAGSCRILTDGSSCGALAMVYVASRRGKKLIISRNSHQSVWNGCRLFGVEPIAIQGQTVNGIALPPDPWEVEKLISKDGDIAGILVTHPDYYGNFAPLSQYYATAKKYGRLLLVDGAHGAHLAYEPDRSGHASGFADMWVDGAHKTLPALTQGAVLCINNPSLLNGADEGLSLFRTTSPSFPIMASVEYGVKYYANNPETYKRAKDAVFEFRANCKALKLYPSDDWTKLVIDCEPFGAGSGEVQKLLQEKGIYPEMSDGRYLLFYLSPNIDLKKLDKLACAVERAATDKRAKGTYVPRAAMPEAGKNCGFNYALRQDNELVELERAAGRICARNAGITPPCTPVIAAGEIISEDAVRILQSSAETFGLTDGKASVVKK